MANLNSFKFELRSYCVSQNLKIYTKESSDVAMHTLEAPLPAKATGHFLRCPKKIQGKPVPQWVQEPFVEQRGLRSPSLSNVLYLIGCRGSPLVPFPITSGRNTNNLQMQLGREYIPVDFGVSETWVHACRLEDRHQSYHGRP